jgi:hypothetical protein
MAKMPSRLKVDHFPKNGRPEKASERAGTGKSLFSSNSTPGIGYVKPKLGVGPSKTGTFATGKAGAKVTKRADHHIGEQGARSRPGGQFSASGNGAKGHKFSAPDADKSATFAHGNKHGVPKSQMATPADAHHKGNRAHHGDGNAKVPRGEHHAAGHREPRTHDEFDKLGSPGDGRY